MRTFRPCCFVLKKGVMFYVHEFLSFVFISFVVYVDFCPRFDLLFTFECVGLA